MEDFSSISSAHLLTDKPGLLLKDKSCYLRLKNKFPVHSLRIYEHALRRETVPMTIPTQHELGLSLGRSGWMSGFSIVSIPQLSVGLEECGVEFIHTLLLASASSLTEKIQTPVA